MNTLISIFCFIIIIFLIAILLLQLHIEYITYLILLLYLGGILIFFLFTTLMLNNEYTSVKIVTQYSLENMLLLLFCCKLFFFMSYLNLKICSFIESFYSKEYSPMLIQNNYFLKELLSNQGDVITFLSLYTEKSILIFILGMILLFTMMGVIVITKGKYV
jgi:NADH:ubiquinone oxidoreductase subunit 6 (subunit J)